VARRIVSRQLFRLGIVIQFSIIFLCSARICQAQVPESELRSAFVFNFIRFTEFPQHTGTLVLCVSEGTSMYSRIAGGAVEEAGRGRPIEVKQTTDAEFMEHCDVAYFPRDRQQPDAELLRALAEKHTLTIGDNEDFLRDGGMIKIYREGAKIRFEINPKCVERAGLRLSSKVLVLAKIYYE
jgi:hypothetical protein